MSKNLPDEYADIFKTGDSLDRGLLARTVKPYIHIYEDGGVPEIVFTADGDKLTNKQKILVYLLGRKILLDTDRLLAEEKEGLTPSELEAQTGIPGGSLRPVLKNLLQGRLVQKDESHYYVPNYSLTKVSEEITEE